MIKVAAIFGDNMVLQRETQILIWGEGEDGEAVDIQFLGKSYSGKVENGKWEIKMDSAEAGGPHTMDITGKDTKIHFDNILIGEVWFAGGQSNMELELQNSDDGLTVAKNSNYESIRFYNVPKQPYFSEDFEEEEEKASWQPAVGSVTDTMSAVAYYFAIKVQETLNVPIGIIDCYWGGTSALCWIGKDTVTGDEIAAPYYQEYLDIVNSKTDEQYEREMQEYQADWDAWDGRVQKLRAENPDIKWEEINERAGFCPWPQPMGAKSGYRPCGLHETMVMRVAPYTLRGFLYYQGEEDWNKSQYYQRLNSLVIKQWREDFRDDTLDFYLTQLPMYREKGQPDDKNWCILREQQELTMRNNINTGMAVIIDCGEMDNIHPTDKKTPGERLALQCLGKTYGKLEQYDNMYFADAKFEEKRVTLQFHNTYGKVQTDCRPPIDMGSYAEGPDNRKLKGFEVSGDGEHYEAVDGEISGEEIILFCDNIPNPQHVRYAWTNLGIVNVYNGIGLPLAQFRK